MHMMEYISHCFINLDIINKNWKQEIASFFCVKKSSGKRGVRKFLQLPLKEKLINKFLISIKRK